MFLIQGGGGVIYGGLIFGGLRYNILYFVIVRIYIAHELMQFLHCMEA